MYAITIYIIFFSALIKCKVIINEIINNSNKFIDTQY